LSSYETQALQGVTKSKGNKKLLIIILLLIGLIGAGVGVALFFILQPKDEKPVEAIVCEVEVISYYVENNDQIVIGDSDKFSFTEETQETSNFTKDLEGQITEIRDIAMVYLVNNTTQNNYVYRFDFSELVIQNCNVTVKINGGETYAINDARRYVSVTQAGDIVLEIKISLAEIPDYEEIQTWIENTKCEGPISLTLSLE